MAYKFLVTDSSGTEPIQTTLDSAMSPGKGNGGAVTQLTNKATGVTLNTLTGKITMNNASLATLTVATFTLTNSLITATDLVEVRHVSGGTPGAYTLTSFPGAGTCDISLMNVTGGSLVEAVVLRFRVVRSADS